MLEVLGCRVMESAPTFFFDNPIGDPLVKFTSEARTFRSRALVDAFYWWHLPFVMAPHWLHHCIIERVPRVGNVLLLGLFARELRKVMGFMLTASLRIGR